MELTVHEVKKTFHKMSEYISQSGNNYSLWYSDDLAVSIHEDDQDIVSILDRKTGKFTFIHEDTKRGYDILKEVMDGKL